MGRNDKSVFPKLVRPRTFASLRVLLGLLVASGLLAWHAAIPFYTPAIALVVERSGSQPGALRGQVLLICAGPEALEHLRVGQSVFLSVNGGSERIRTEIIAVEPHLLSPQTAQESHGLSPAALQRTSGPRAVAVARAPQALRGLPATITKGSYYRAEVETGSQRLIDLLR